MRRLRTGAAIFAVASLSLLGLGTVTHAAITQVVVPNANTTAGGNIRSQVLPWNCFHGLGGSTTAIRYQQVYAGNEVGTGTITQIAYRPYGPAFSAIYNNATITMSTTTKGPNGLSTTFASNVGSDVKTVFSGNLTLTSPGQDFPALGFGVVIPLQSGFAFNPAGGNLLLDITLPSCPSYSGDTYDSYFQSTAPTSRVFAFSTTDAAGTTDPSGLFGGLITQFTISSTPPSGGTCD